MASGIHHLRIAETPIAILDIETTGLNAGNDKIVEISVFRIDPGSEPKLVFDTLVNPSRRMGATEIHGITDEDVANAPHFPEIVDALVYSISECVVAAYNVYFDMRFIEYEMRNCGISESLPHFCLMYMRPLLKLGPRCCLGDACISHNIPYSNAHIASADAEASALLLKFYMDAIADQGIQTFRDLESQKSYKFFNSFAFSPIVYSKSAATPHFHRVCSRSSKKIAVSIEPSPRPIQSLKSRLNEGLVHYWDALKAAVTDLIITDEEVQQLKNIELSYGLTGDHIRFLHARIFSAVINQFIDDQELDDRERRKLKRLHQCLSILGWAPGE
jgi:DNA polymerase III subunit epsilon